MNFRLLAAFALLLAAGCSISVVSEDDGAGTGGTPVSDFTISVNSGGDSCAVVRSPDADPVVIHFVNQTDHSLNLDDECPEVGNVGLARVAIDDVPLRFYGNCDDMIEGVACQPDCWGGSDQGDIEAHATLDYAWNGKLMILPPGASGADAWTPMPSVCDTAHCGYQSCHPLTVAAPGEHTISVGHGETSITQTFTLPATELTFELTD